MGEYTFDASVTVDSDDFSDELAASNHILETLLDGEVAAFLCKDGTLNSKAAQAEIERLTAERSDRDRVAFNAGFEAGHFWNRPSGSVMLYKADEEYREKCWTKFVSGREGS